MSYYLYYAPAILTCQSALLSCALRQCDMSQAQKLYLLYPFSLHLTTARLFIQRFLDSKKDSLGRTALFREGISFLWGIAKNYIMYWGGYK